MIYPETALLWHQFSSKFRLNSTKTSYHRQKNKWVYRCLSLRKCFYTNKMQWTPSFGHFVSLSVFKSICIMSMDFCWNNDHWKPPKAFVLMLLSWFIQRELLSTYFNNFPNESFVESPWLAYSLAIQHFNRNCATWNIWIAWSLLHAFLI